MKCSNCGMKLPPSSRICSRCKKAVAKDFNYHNMENELLNTVLEDENITAYAPKADTASGGQSAKKAGSKTKSKAKPKAKPEKKLEQKSKQESKQELKQESKQEPEELKDETNVTKQWGKFGASLLAGAAAFACLVFVMQSFSDEYAQDKTEIEYQNCLSALAQEDYDAALESVDALLQEEKDNLEYLSLKNTICEKSGNKKMQMTALRKIIVEDPDNYPAYEQLLQLYMDTQNQAEIRKLSAAPPNSIIAAMIRACMVDAPYFELPPGVYDSNQLLEITSEQGHEIYYTLDGTVPMENGKLYVQPIPLEQGIQYMIRAVCKNTSGTYGEEADGEYRIGINARPADSAAVPEPPEVVPKGGTYNTRQLITISIPIGNRAYYSWTPGIELTPENGTLYSGGIVMPQGDSVLSVIQADAEGNYSEVRQISYTYAP